MYDVPGIHLPRVFVASDGRSDWSPPERGDVGLLLRDTSLPLLLHHADRGYVVAVDSDSVEGLSEDDLAMEFLVHRLGFRIVLSRHPGTAAQVARLGALSFMRVFALDSSGFQRSLEGHPRGEGVGTVLCPGLVLPHLSDDELALLPRPILAYGLIDRPEDIAACLRRADAIVLSGRALDGAGASEALAEIAREAQPTAM